MAAAAFQVDIANEEAYKKDVLSKGTALHVVEVYQAWCGPSKAVQSTFKKILLDSPDAAIQFFTVCAAKVPALEKYDHCEPKLLLVKDSKAVEEVVGLQLPKLTRLIQQLSTGGRALAQRHSSTEE